MNDRQHNCGADAASTDALYPCETLVDDPHDDGNYWLTCTTHDHLIRTVEVRTATVSTASVGWGDIGGSLRVVTQYLPANYTAEVVPALYDEGDQIVITGYDHAGWTLDAYVLPRLASGGIFATEVN